MSVIRKLSIYLNNLFEDDNPRELPMAKTYSWRYKIRRFSR